MKISVTDKQNTGITLQFAHAIGATVRGRFIDIPASKGGGYITGFSWGNNELRMMLRNYYLKEEILIERTNELVEGQDDVVFMLSGIFPPTLETEKQLQPEQPNVFICMHAISSVITMPSNTFFRSITIAVSREYLRGTFGNITHPIVDSILNSKDNFAYETGISPEMVKTASEILQPVSESLESHYCKLKCEELLCCIFAQLIQRETLPTSNMHIEDIKSIYAIKLRLQSALSESPNIALLAKEAGMSEPKLRKLFKQTFGKGVFEYFQSARIQEAARLLKDKHLTVSEVGYQLGFTNLSHFSRVFEQHIGIKPKKYSVISGS
ncbi:helix-turn-helix domain-containing protein [Flavobacterium sp.]|uniref:helix-turn-helix domain-containing protein n=1 Tax=Flavobacterium sp. TaxID=239 RepID=UPI003D13E049